MKKFKKTLPARLIVLLMSLIMMVMSTMSMSSFAIGDYDDIAAGGYNNDGSAANFASPDLTAYTFDELCSKEVVFYNDIEKMKVGTEIQRAIYYNCKNAQEYSKWLNNAKEAVAHSSAGSAGSAGSASDGVIFQPHPNWKNFGSTDPNTEPSDDQSYTKGWSAYNTSSNKMTMIMARGASEQLTGDVFGRDFDPTNAVTLAAMDTFTMICNSIFNLIAKALMLLFLVQTGFDVLYLVIPATQGILAPANAHAGSGGNGVAQGGKFSMRFNLVSNECIEANNRSATGSVGGGGGGKNDSGFLQSNIFMRYLIARAPLILLALTYIVLVATNIWADMITALASWISGIAYGIL